MSAIPGPLPPDPLPALNLDPWLSNAGHRSSGLRRLGRATIPGLAFVTAGATRSLVLVVIAIVLIFVLLPAALLAAGP